MALQNEQEWAEAQKITVSVDLVETAKKLLKFVAVVDRNRFLYEGHALERVIYRYNALWIPLLAKHLKNPLVEGSLVVPLDCEWIWHCHRLNPIRYKIDCEKLFGRILGNHNIISSVEAPSTAATKGIWNKLYPEEPYELDLSTPFVEDTLQKKSLTEKFTSYDLVSAVKRQASFAFQVCRPHMMDELFLREAAARYKGFLHLIRINRKMSLEQLCVPTYDVDLMWHTHQLYPEAYSKDMGKLVGSIVHHDDTVSDRTKGGKLDKGQFETTRQWEDTFGFSYWKAGATHRGNDPSPVTQIPYKVNAELNDFNTFEKCGQQIHIPALKTVEVLLEFVDIKNLPEEYKENLVVAFSKKNPDKFLNSKRSLGISSIYKDKQVSLFQCEPKGEFLFELMCHSPSNETKTKLIKVLGSCSLSLEEMLLTQSRLATNKWLLVDLVSSIEISKPVSLQVSISFTPPAPAPQLFQLERAGVQAHVMDYDGKKVFSLQTRNIAHDAPNCTSPFGKEVYCVTNSGEKHTLVEFNGNYWFIKGTHGSFKLQFNYENDESLFELVGDKMVKLFPGRRLAYESNHNSNKIFEQEFMTIVEFSVESPYGKAVALIDTKSGTIKAKNEWIVLPGIAMAFILCDTLTNEEKNSYFKDAQKKDKEKVEVAALCAGECVDKMDEELTEAGGNWTSGGIGKVEAAAICVGCWGRSGIFGF
ncbi:glycine-rich domain-containing protein 1-like isoform X2 [Silene latifolia]|uniref:glycine-rich domain-containing protein 1-like isoform X2 n=1 Tax=Silene latifolia TaxID=37657 RepID=UPI003D7751C5